MKKHIHLLYLALGFLALIVSNGRFTVPIATWIAPVFLLLFTRQTKRKGIYCIVSLVIGVAYQLAFWKFSSSNPRNILFYLPFVMGFVLALPYLVDRVLGQRFNGVIRTLIFPLAYTAVEFIALSLNPLGTTGSLAYTQTEFLTLVQIVSITGIYGVTFLITWFASTAAYGITERKWQVLKCGIPFVIVFIVVLTFGGVRLLSPEKGQTVRISGLHVYDLRSAAVQETWDKVAQNTDAFRTMCDKILVNLLAKTKQEAQAGSKIIVWSEIAPLMLQADEGKYIAALQSCARENHIYIVACPYVLSKDYKSRDTNKLLIFDPAGTIVLEHYKYGGALLDNIIVGNKKLQAVDTPYGRLSGVICWDADFPAILRQEGRLGTEMLFSPAADWEEIDPIHSEPAYFRGLENGMSVLRQTVNGLSFASDSKGRMLARMDHYSGTDWTMTVQLPMHRSFTLYPYIGDTFAYLVCIAFCVLVGVFISKRRKDLTNPLNDKVEGY